MTIKNAVEIILQQFPNFGETQVIKDLDLSQKLFCDETQVYRKELNSLSVTLQADLETAIIFDGLNDTFLVENDEFGLVVPLPSDCIRLKNIKFLDSNNIIIAENLIWDFADGKLHFRSLTNEKLTQFPSTIKKVILQYIAKPVLITSMSSSFTIPEQFHYAVICDVLQRYWALQGVLQNAGYWRSEYSRFKVQAKIYSNESFGANYINISNLGI